ncbi:hypothetical protein J2744_000449 [Halorubrum trapanicum]|uniref:Uncharacterized protein n=1 Tax=Halorubrum trapanicum TaxID=29284 RepID=A0A8J7R6J8_9EURY|nr:hypothetical protein [Halorubrum trapanicum]MBP1900797.1 hypothetical protein [Halorubrum trapanicum]
MSHDRPASGFGRRTRADGDGVAERTDARTPVLRSGRTAGTHAGGAAAGGTDA